MADNILISSKTTPVTYKDISEAYERIRSHIHRTPVITCSTIDALVGRKVYFKCENLQKTGSFKARGALNAALKLRQTAPDVGGVVAYTSGNHGQALAWAARQVGISCTVVLPYNTSAVKCDAIRGYGANLVHCQPTPQEREAVCRRIAAEKHHAVIPTCDHYDVIAGQGTTAIEFLDEVPELDAIFSPLGGGGLLSGCAIVADQISPSTRMFAVEPQGKDLERSLRAGKRLWPDPPRFLDTVADGMRLQPAGKLTFPILCQLVQKQVFSISDEDMIFSMKLMLQRTKMMIEPTSAAGVAAVLSDQMKNLDDSIKNVGVIIGGGNVDLDALPWQ